MAEQWQQEAAAADVKLSRYLLTQADNKGLTHGEKHYLIQATLFLLHKAQNALDASGSSALDRHQVEYLKASDVPSVSVEEKSDIPF